MDTVSYNTEEKIRLLRANGYVVREGKVFVVKDRVPIASRSSFAFKAGRKYDIDTVFDSTIKSIFLKMNPTGGGEEEEEEEGGFYTEGAGIDITGAVISLSHLGLEDLTAPGEDKILFYDYSAGAVGWANFAEATSKLKISSNDTTPGYLEDKLALSYGGNESEILEFSTIGEGADETRILQIDETKISHDNIADVSVDDHHSEVHTLATAGPHTDSLPLVDLAPGTAGDIITRQVSDWAVLAKGTQNYVLKMGATYPGWGTVDWSELTGSQPAPIAHNHAWSDITSGVPTTFAGYGINDTLANLNTALSDATLYEWEADQGAVNIHGDNVVYGSAASTACVGNDARLSDARTPTAHASSHITGGGDIIATATSTAVGLLPILSNVVTEYLDGTGGWSVPTGGVSLGTTTQIPYMNVAGDDFLYSANLVFTVTGLGIGTASPQEKLHIQGAGAQRLEIETDDESSPVLKFTRNNLDSKSIYLANDPLGGTSLNFYDYDSGDTKMILLDSGNVGIGTTSPIELLHLKTASGTSTDFALDEAGIGWRIRNDQAANRLAIASVTSSTGELFDQRTDRFTILADGKVGINVINPVKQLYVKSSQDVMVTFESTDANVFLSFMDNTTTDNAKVRIGAIGDNMKLFAGGSERIRILSDGKVGINDDSPSYQLDVNGTGRFTDTLTSTKSVAAGPSFSGGNLLFAGDQNIYFNVDQNDDFLENHFYFLSDTSTSGGGNILFFISDLKTYCATKLGINNNDPTYSLDVTGTGRFTDDVIIGTLNNDNALITTDANGKLISETNLIFDGTTFKVKGATYETQILPQTIDFTRNSANYIKAATAGGYMCFITNGLAQASVNSLLYLTTTEVQLRYGSTAPTALKLETTSTGVRITGSLLDIYGATSATLNLEANAGHCYLNLDAGGAGNDIRLQFQDDGANKWLQKFESSNDSMFFYNYALGSNVITMLNDGKVGILDSTPSYILDVNGTGRFTGNLYCNAYIYLGVSDYILFGTDVSRIYHDDTDFFIRSLKHGGRIIMQGENAAGSNKALIYADPDGAVDFYYAGVKKFETTSVGATVTGRITANTAVAAGYAGFFFNDGGFTTRWGIGIQCGEDVVSTNNYPIKFFDGDYGGIANINYDTDSIQFAFTSDITLKENIKDYNIDGLSIIKQMQYRVYNWKRDSNKLESHGWIADEVEQIFPDMVSVDPESDYKMISPSKLIPVMMAGIKQHYNITKSHEDKIIQLEKRVKDLEDEVELLKN